MIKIEKTSTNIFSLFPKQNYSNTIMQRLSGTLLVLTLTLAAFLFGINVTMCFGSEASFLSKIIPIHIPKILYIISILSHFVFLTRLPIPFNDLNVAKDFALYSLFVGSLTTSASFYFSLF